MNIDIGLINRSFQRALLFNIPKGVRLISFQEKDDNEIDMLVVCECELDEDARDFIFTAACEIEGDFVEIKKCNVEFKVDNGVIDNAPMLRHVVFALAS